MAALQSHSSFRGQSERAVGGGEPREDLGWGKLNRSHGERSVGREQQAHAHESRGGEPRERPMPGVHATRRGHLALPCVTLPSHARRALLARSHPRIATPAEPFCFFLPVPPPPPSLLFLLLFTFSTTFTMFLCRSSIVVLVVLVVLVVVVVLLFVVVVVAAAF